MDWARNLDTYNDSQDDESEQDDFVYPEPTAAEVEWEERIRRGEEEREEELPF